MSKLRHQQFETREPGPEENSGEANSEQKNIAGRSLAGSPNRPRYFERPAQDERPLSLFETFMIVLSAHLGVRTRKKRQDDFRRANGFYLFLAGIVYFLLLIVGLVVLARLLTR